MKKWRKLKPNQFAWLKGMSALWFLFIISLLLLYVPLKDQKLLIGAVTISVSGLAFFAIIFYITRKTRKVSSLMESFIRKNSLYQSHYILQRSLFGDNEVERMDYYPRLEYREVRQNNYFCIRIRMDGSLRAEKFRDLEQALADMFCTVCTDKIEERGYLTFCFELRKQEQIKIQSSADILSAGASEIAFSHDIVWDWKKSPHLLLTGNTGSGKTQLTQYIIACLLKQGVRVIYCDPKNDDEMRIFMQQHSAVYVSTVNDIARVVRETEEEVRLREADLSKIGIEEAEFCPIFLMFDEMIAFAKISDKKNYEETTKKLGSIVVTGRSKRVYAGIILQRPDTSFIEGAIRDNLSCRICMGQMSDTAYQMAFGSDFRNVKNQRHEIGSGLIYRQGIDTKPREFIAPFICKGALLKQ